MVRLDGALELLSELRVRALGYNELAQYFFEFIGTHFVGLAIVLHEERKACRIEVLLWNTIGGRSWPCLKTQSDSSHGTFFFCLAYRRAPGMARPAV